MTKVYITIDTEYGAGIYVREGLNCRESNFNRSIRGLTQQGEVGIFYQMDVFDRHGLKGVFFVDPMPALVWGVEAIADVVQPIIARGHDVQLHLHPEWLAFAGDNVITGSKTGQNMKDFSQDEQCRLLDYALTVLVKAGAPKPVAFRAGNYGANDDTLRALGELGIAYDTSHCPGIANSHCAISLGEKDRVPIHHCGTIEVPIGCIETANGGLRHAQITALSAEEMIAAIGHARDFGADRFTLVSHSFELLSRDRSRINKLVKSRFEKLCIGIAKMQDVATGTYAESPPKIDERASTMPVLPHNRLRTLRRYAEQAIGNALYGAA